MKAALRRGTFYGVLQQIAIALAYAGGYALLRDLSVSHWNLTSGLRVLCLLLVPYRYWPALIVGEALPLAYAGWSNHERFGWIWACAIAVPPMLLSAPLFAWCRRRMPLFREGEIHVATMLVSILIGALVIALSSAGTFMLMRAPLGETLPVISSHIVLTYFLGSYLGALTLVPAFLAWWSVVSKAPIAWIDMVRSKFFVHCVTGVLPPLLLLMWMASTTHSDDILQIVRIAMFLPAAWMTLQHGWKGAAAAGALASVATQLTETVLRDPSVIQAQSLIAFAVSSLLMLGARLPRTEQRASSDAEDSDDWLRGFQLAQQGLYQEEQRLRHVAESLERLGQAMRDGQQRMMDRLRPMLPANMEHSYVRHIDHTQREMHRLANALHPRSWREHGLAATFQNGPLAQAASLVGASYRCTLSGDGLNQLAPDVHMMLYRQACEVLVYLLAREPLRSVHVQIRGGSTRGRRWVVLRVIGARAALTQRGRSVPEWRQLVSLLGTNGQGAATIRERALIYGGVVHERESDTRLGVTLLLHDALRFDLPQTTDEPFARVA
ncbi:MASE1 domain-containing protein [Dyella sp. 20L07]|uniref:MASE1 domain-containing protein n=1 Tax=Dyella sp. 20L07 TaxID=3384240 RepID=UPI003D273209